MFPKPRSENEVAGTREATLAWITELSTMEARDSRVCVIMTGRSEESLHPDIASRFGGSKIENL